MVRHALGRTRVAVRVTGVTLLVAVLASMSSPPAPAAAAKPVVVVYGDSLSVEAREYLGWYLGDRFTPVIVAVSGTSPCDHIDNMGERVRRGERPAMVVLAFVGNGNTASPCIKEEPRFSLPIAEVYTVDLATAAGLWGRAGVPVALVAGPPVVPLAWNDEWVERAEAVRAAVGATARSTGARLIDVAPVFTEMGRPVMRATCRAWDLCSGTVVIRSADGLHFCPTGSSADPRYAGDVLKLLSSSLCLSAAKDRPIYSAGAHRYGREIAVQVKAALAAGPGARRSA